MPKHKGLNEYKIEGDITTIFITQRNGNKHNFIIDTEDLEKLIDLDYSWHVRYAEDTGTYYVMTTLYLGINNKPRYQTKCITYYLMGMLEGASIDHINHDSLDNRKENLRVINVDKNGMNRKNKNSNNKSGYRNVSLIQNKWVVQLQINGKNTRIKSFPLDHLDEAGAYAELMRNELYGEFAGVS